MVTGSSKVCRGTRKTAGNVSGGQGFVSVNGSVREASERQRNRVGAGRGGLGEGIGAVLTSACNTGSRATSSRTPPSTARPSRPTRRRCPAEERKARSAPGREGVGRRRHGVLGRPPLEGPKDGHTPARQAAPASAPRGVRTRATGGGGAPTNATASRRRQHPPPSRPPTTRHRPRWHRPASPRRRRHRRPSSARSARPLGRTPRRTCGTKARPPVRPSVRRYVRRYVHHETGPVRTTSPRRKKVRPTGSERSPRPHAACWNACWNARGPFFHIPRDGAPLSTTPVLWSGTEPEGALPSKLGPGS